MSGEYPSPAFFDSVSFAGCGTVNFYQTGVGHVLQREGLAADLRFGGASSGAGLSVLMAAGVDMQEVAQVAAELLAPYAGRTILNDHTILRSFAGRFLARFLDDSCLERVQGRVCLSITTLRPFRNLLISEFTDLEDLASAIRASCHIPSLKVPTVRFRGKRCIDGGLTCNNPIVSERCLLVSPFRFSRATDLYPRSGVVPWRAVFVPTPEEADGWFERGVADAEAYLAELRSGKKHVRPKGGWRARLLGKSQTAFTMAAQRTPSR